MIRRFPSPLSSLGLVVASVSLGLGWVVAGWSVKSRATAGATSTSQAPGKPRRPGGAASGTLSADIAAVAAAGDVSAQMAAAIALADRLAPDDFAKFLENIRHLPAHSAQGLASRAVLRRWVALDPAAALDWTLKHDRDLVAGVIAEWARLLPPADAASLIERLPADRRADAVGKLFGVLATRDREAAMALIEQQAHDMPYVHLMASAMTALAREDAAWLLERADSLPENIRRTVRDSAVRAMSEVDLEGAVAWARSQPDAGRLIQSLVQFTKDPSAMLGAVATLPHTEQAALDGHVFFHGRITDPHGFLDTIQEHWDRLHEPVRRGMLQQTAYALSKVENPGEFADRLLALGEEPAHSLIRNLVSQWAARSPEDARAWASALEGEDHRRIAMQSLEAVARADEAAESQSIFDRLMRKAGSEDLSNEYRLLTLSKDERRQVIEASLKAARPREIAEDPFGSSPEAPISRFSAETAQSLSAMVVADYHPSLLEPLARTAAYWASENPSAAAAWASTLPPGEARAWAAANVLLSSRVFDPSAGQALLESLSAEERVIVDKALGEPGR